ADGNTATSDDQTFETIGAAPVQTLITATGITAVSATVTWTTDEGADSLVQYGTTTEYGQRTEQDSEVETRSSGKLSGLTEKKTYQYRVISKDVDGNTATGDDQTFETIGAAPVQTLITATGITAVSATVTWTTDEGADSLVQYGTTTEYGQ